MTRFLRALFGFALIIVVFMIGLLTWQPGSVAYKDVVLYVAVIGAAYWLSYVFFFLLGKGELLSSLQWVVSVVLFVTLVLTLYVGEIYSRAWYTTASAGQTVENGYEIIAGERRWRAAQLAGLTHVPVVVRDIDDRQAAEISLIENIQRDDLTVVEEAKAYRMLAEQFGYTQETIAEKIGKSRAYVANTLRILNLPEEILQMLEKGELSAGHVRPLLALPTAEEQLAAAKEIVANKMTVRQVENKVKTKRIKFDIPADKPVELVEIQEKLQQHFATRAVVTKHGKGGKIEIAFYSDEDLERILEIMGVFE